MLIKSSVLHSTWEDIPFFFCSHRNHLALSPSVYVKQSHPKQFSSQCDKVWREMIKWARPSDLQCFWKDSEESCSILSLPCLSLFPRHPPLLYLLARRRLFPSLHLFHHHMTFSVVVEGAVSKTQTWKVKFQVPSLSDENDRENKQTINVTKCSQIVFYL